MNNVKDVAKSENPSIFQRVKSFFSSVGGGIVSAFKNLSRSPLDVVIDNVSESTRAKVGFFSSISLLCIGFFVASRVLRRW